MQLPMDKRDGAIILRIRLTPKAARNSVAGIYNAADGQTSLKVTVTAVPEKGKANAALIRFLAKQWKLPRSSLVLISGETDRNKVLRIDAPYDDIAGQIRPFCQE